MFTQISVPGLFTTHDMIYGSYSFDFNMQQHNETFYFHRFLKNINQQSLLIAAETLDWNHIYYIVDVNNKLSYFNSLIVSLLNQFAPLRKCKIKNSDCIFSLNKDILYHRNIRDFLYTL